MDSEVINKDFSQEEVLSAVNNSFNVNKRNTEKFSLELYKGILKELEILNNTKENIQVNEGITRGSK